MSVSKQTNISKIFRFSCRFTLHCCLREHFLTKYFCGFEVSIKYKYNFLPDVYETQYIYVIALSGNLNFKLICLKNTLVRGLEFIGWK